MLNMMPYRRSNALYNPFRELEEIERSFFAPESVVSFRTDIQQNENEVILSADLPGFKKEDIHVDVEENRLVIAAERHSEYEQKEKRDSFLCCERSYGSYSRSFSLEGIDAERISASYEDGVLRLTLPKKVQQKPASRRLEIQ